MKITIMQGAFLPVPPVMGGAVEKRWFLLAKTMREAGHEVNYISRTYHGMPDQEWIDGVNHQRVRGYDTPASSLRLKILDLLYSFRAVRKVPKDADVVVTNTFFAPLLLPNPLKRRTYVDVARMPKGQMKLYGKAARLRANSSPVAKAIQSELPQTEHRRVSMIPNPLPFVPQMDAPDYREKNGLLYCGRLHPEKGIGLLIDALRKMENPPSLRIVGPWKTEHGGGGDAYLHSLKESAEGLPVHFVGPIFSIEELNGEYRKAAAFVYPSLAEKGETFGLAPLEAMAWGCVPIVSDLDCFKDFIRDSQNGFIFDHRSEDPADELARTIHRLQEEPGLAVEISRAAGQVRVTHSAKAIAERFLNDFEQIAGKGNGA